MRLARCEKGHYYDKDKFSTCPHCNDMQVAPSETVAYEDPEAKKEQEAVAPEITETPEMPKVQVEERVLFSAATPVDEENNEIEDDFAQSSPSVTEDDLDDMVTIRLSEHDAMVSAAIAGVEDSDMSKVDAIPEDSVAGEESVTEDSPAAEEEPVREETSSSWEETQTAEEETITEDSAVEEEPIRGEASSSWEEPTREETRTAEEETSTEDATAVEEPVTEDSAVVGDSSIAEESMAVEEENTAMEQSVAATAEDKEETDADSQQSLADAVPNRIPDDALEGMNSNPVIGWLVAIEGIHKGKSYNVKQGRNFVGRSTGMDICLSGNSKISRERHAIITYDPRTKKCYLQPDESRDLLYINEDLLFGPMMMKHNDVITMGEEQFVFLTLQCDKADWI